MMKTLWIEGLETLANIPSRWYALRSIDLTTSENETLMALRFHTPIKDVVMNVVVILAIKS